MKKLLLPLVFLLFTNALFFYPVWAKGLVPFPGDLLLAEYGPWKNFSFFGYAPGAVPTKAQSFDTLRQLYPWRFLAIDSLKEGQWPLWNPFNFSGTPLLANFQTAAFYPLNIFYFFFSFNFVWSAQVVVQPLLASIFMYLYLKRIKISPWGSLIGAIAFAYGSFMTVWLEYNTIGHVLLWLPLTLLAVELLKQSVNLRRLGLLGFSLTFSFLAGHFQDFAMIWAFSLLYGYFKLKNKLVLLVFLSPFFLGAVQLLPGIELIFNSARAPLPRQFLLEQVLLSPKQLIFAIIPDYFGNPATRNYLLTDTYIGKVLYIGLLPLILSLFAVVKRKNFSTRFFFITAVLALLFSVSSPLTGLVYSLPAFSSLSPTRILFIFQFSLAVLAAFGFDRLPRIKQKKKIIIFAVFIMIFALSAVYSPVQPNRNLIYSSALLFISIVLLFPKKVFPFIVVCLIVFDLFRFFHKITPFSLSGSFFPATELTEFLKTKGIERLWGYGTAGINPNTNAVLGLYSPEGYDPLYPRWYGEFIRLSEEGTFKPAIRSDAFVAPGFGRTDFADNQFRRQILNALNVRYLLDRTENLTDQSTFPPEFFELVWQKEDWRVFSNKLVHPRYYFPTTVYSVSSPAEFEQKFFQTEPGSVLLEGESSRTTSYPDAQIGLISYSPQNIRLKTSTSQAQPLYLADTFYPGWTALVDGQPVDIIKANHAFRLIFLPPGEHQIEFTYKPLAFRIGLIISVSALSFWLFTALLIKIKRRSIK